MTVTSGTPSWAEVVSRAIETRVGNLHVALPGKVKSYDASTQTADVQPMVKRIVPSGTDETEDFEEELPIIPSVPVLHPRGGGFYCHVPVAAGDSVLLVFCDADPVQWRKTGQNRAPGDRRMHHLSHAIAIPGLFPSASPIGDASGSNLTLGKDGGIKVTVTASQMQVDGSSDAAALASKVDELDANFASFLSLYAQHIHQFVTPSANATDVSGVLQTQPGLAELTPVAPTASSVLKVGS